MGGEKDRGPVGRQLPYQRPDLTHALRVEAIGRLVEHQQFPRLQQRGRESQPLFHAQGVRLGLLARGRGQPDPVQRGGDAAAPGARIGAGVGGVVAQQIVPAIQEPVQRGPFDQRAHLRQYGPNGARHGFAEDRGAARGRLDEPHQHPDGGGLAGAVGPQEPEDAAVGHAQIESVDGQLAAPVPLGEPVRLDDGCHSGPPFRSVSGPPRRMERTAGRTVSACRAARWALRGATCPRWRPSRARPWSRRRHRPCRRPSSAH